MVKAPKVLDIKIYDSIVVNPLGNRYYSTASDVLTISIVTDQGTFTCKLKRGFITNFRSGGRGVDGFIDQIGDTQIQQALWVFHDACYTRCYSCNGNHPISKELADELLYQGLLFAGVPKWKAGIVYYSVKWFGGSAYNDDDELTKTNSVLFTFDWSEK